MAFLDLAPSGKRLPFDFNVEKAMRAPLGAASPLWLAFAGATSVGVAMWLASRWLQPMELRGFMFRPQAAPPVLDPVVEATAELVAEAPVLIEAVAEAPVEVVAKAIAPVVEAAPEPVAEAAPPVVEPAPAPKVAAAPKAEPVRKPKAEPEAAPSPKLAAPKTAASHPTAAKALADRRRASKKSVSAVPPRPKKR